MYKLLTINLSSSCSKDTNGLTRYVKIRNGINLRCIHDSQIIQNWNLYVNNLLSKARKQVETVEGYIILVRKQPVLTNGKILYKKAEDNTAGFTLVLLTEGQYLDILHEYGREKFDLKNDTFTWRI